MEKLNTNQISMYEVVNGRYHDDNQGWVDMSEDLQYELSEKFKEFLLNRCRYGSRPYFAINRADFTQVEPYGILRRFIYDTKKDKVEYIVGQSEPEEIATLKKLVTK